MTGLADENTLLVINDDLSSGADATRYGSIADSKKNTTTNEASSSSKGYMTIVSNILMVAGGISICGFAIYGIVAFIEGNDCVGNRPDILYSVDNSIKLSLDGKKSDGNFDHCTRNVGVCKDSCENSASNLADTFFGSGGGLFARAALEKIVDTACKCMPSGSVTARIPFR